MYPNSTYWLADLQSHDPKYREREKGLFFILSDSQKNEGLFAVQKRKKVFSVFSPGICPRKLS